MENTNWKKISITACLLITGLFIAFTTFACRTNQNNNSIQGNVKNHLVWADPDSCMYIMHAQNSEKNFRYHWTNLDNYPEGRPMYWSNIFIWELKISGWIYQKIEGILGKNYTREEAIERGAILPNQMLFFLASILLAIVLINECGPFAGSVIFFFILFHPKINDIFSPIYPHHRALSLFLNAIFFSSLGLGYLKNKKIPFIIAGLACGLGIWLSALNTIPYLIIGALASITTAFFLRKEKSKEIIWAEGWQLLGWSSGAISLLGWLIEFFPKIPLELEINSILYSLALVGGCHAIAIIHCYINKLKKRKTDIIISVVFLTPILLTFFILRNDAFMLFDPVNKNLLGVIIEMMRVNEAPFREYNSIFLLFAIAGVTLKNSWVEADPLKKSAYVYFFAASTLLLLFSVTAQRTQTPTLISTAICLALLIGASTNKKKTDIQIFGSFFLMAITLINSMIIFNGYQDTISGQKEASMSNQTKAYAQKSEIINNWGEKNKKEPAVLVPDPSQATYILYFLKGKVGPTIYWDNLAGLKTGALILANSDLKTAKKTLLEKGFTHLLITDPKQLYSPIVEAHGKKELQKLISHSKEYSGFVWLEKQTRPEWLIESKEDPSILEINREKLKETIDKETNE